MYPAGDSISSLETQQRGLLDLIKQRGDPPNDPYLWHVKDSRELAMLREIAIWWRKFQLEHQCRLTSRLLKRVDCFDSLVAAYFDSHATSPFVEELSLGFLKFLNVHEDPLIRSLAQFEEAMLQTVYGSCQRHEEVWDRHPDEALKAVAQGSEIPPPETGCLYRMRIAADLLQVVSWTREGYAKS